MKWIIAGIITLYQKCISPRKGFVCAHRRLYGDDSCSAAVKKIVLARGLLAGLAAIRTRFQACRLAAETLREKVNTPQRGDLDCSLGSCDGCADSGIVNSCFGGAEAGPSATENKPVVVVSIGICALALLLICSYWFYGRQVSSIDIKLIDVTQETEDRGLAKLFKQQLPDYQIILAVEGSQVKTNTLRNASAKDWLSFHPRQSVYPSEINRLSIINKQIRDDQIIEVLEKPEIQGKGEYFEYVIHRHWELF